MTIGRLLFAGLLVLTALPGCGSADDPEKAKQQCEDLVARFCTSAFSCAVSGGLVDASVKESEIATCKADAAEAVECKRAQSVTSSYDLCMSKLANPPCDEFNRAFMAGTLQLPAECNGVILVPV
jgi:hypothetical protein